MLEICYFIAVRGQAEAAGGWPGAQGARGGLQVCEEVQCVQHQQPVDQPARHPARAGGEHS